jgi:hypothetical protein
MKLKGISELLKDGRRYDRIAFMLFRLACIKIKIYLKCKQIAIAPSAPNQGAPNKNHNS